MIELKVVFGKEQVQKMLNHIPLSKEDLELNFKVYSFNTEEEAIAFENGLNEAIGWLEVFVLKDDITF